MEPLIHIPDCTEQASLGYVHTVINESVIDPVWPPHHSHAFHFHILLLTLIEGSSRFLALASVHVVWGCVDQLDNFVDVSAIHVYNQHRKHVHMLGLEEDLPVLIYKLHKAVPRQLNM